MKVTDSLKNTESSTNHHNSYSFQIVSYSNHYQYDRIIYKLKASSLTERNHWINTLRNYSRSKSCSNGSTGTNTRESSLDRHDKRLSASQNRLSVTSFQSVNSNFSGNSCQNQDKKEKAIGPQSEVPAISATSIKKVQKSDSYNFLNCFGMPAVEKSKSQAGSHEDLNQFLACSNSQSRPHKNSKPVQLKEDAIILPQIQLNQIDMNQNLSPPLPVKSEKIDANFIAKNLPEKIADNFTHISRKIDMVDVKLKNLNLQQNFLSKSQGDCIFRIKTTQQQNVNYQKLLKLKIYLESIKNRLHLQLNLVNHISNNLNLYVKENVVCRRVIFSLGYF